jgi:exopolyphosphatase / guanosine-5'-triphosphate,3'-diphosphate pyrophosphatase
MPEGNLYAAIDLGSNSFHMLVARREHGELRVIDRIKDMVRLAGGIDDNGHLDPEARARALDCLARFGQRIAAIPGEQVRAVGTQTFRQLDNPAAFLVVAETALGCSIDIISGREEARLVYLGVSQATAYSDRRLVIDIGGGSTELVIGESLDPLLTESVPLGCVSMTRKAFADGQLDRDRWQRAVQIVQADLLDLEAGMRGLGWDQAVGSSGTIRALETMAARARDEESGRITLVELERLRDKMLAAGHVERLDIAGLSERRRPVIVGGAVILEAVMKQLGIETMSVSPHALREGVLHDLLGRLSHQDPRARSVAAMARRYQCEPKQASRVRDWALQAADQVAEAWSLKSTHLELLDWACQLHELGLAITHDQHHRHGAYVIEHADMPGFSRQEQQFMAALVATQRFRLDADLIERQPPRLHAPLRYLIAIMRLGVTLCRARVDSDVPDFSLRAESDGLELRLPSGWLESHPLSARGLAYQRRQLEKIGLDLKLGVLSDAERPA